MNPNASGWNPTAGSFSPGGFAKPAFDAAPPAKPAFDARKPPAFDARAPPAFDARPPAFDARPPKPAFDAAPPGKPAFDAAPPAAVSIGGASISSKPKAAVSIGGASISSKPAASISSKPKPAPAPAPAPMDTSEDAVDESDPLFLAVLAIAGSRERALKMIEDPDSLLQYPEVVRIMESMPESRMEEEGDAKVEEAAMAVEAMQVDKPPPAPKAAPKAAEPEAAEEAEPDVALTEGDPREHLNIVFIGHVDAGKSTLSGNILYLTDNVDKRTIERYEREAKDRNRESWFLAFIMDTNEEERAKGKTVEVGRAYFDTPDKRYTILDAPGHKNYVPNMIMGASQADVGVLVISARKGEFEAGFDRGGQTREHAMLCKTLGINYLIVVINKMDDPTVNWSKER
ncbi:hypothetical protein TeGR_g6974 [Tetraparma gracilis]|uniref:Tr-type G domain-containing protein n=1 Tax=Tetraparma gracilis TaxID=2962635 RepID=A0ABQ6NAE4_9STRA|nr:hypothetical protein TeGR_g6974 [Tetraparma gracilis]